MEKTDSRYRHFVQILREELVPAMGCTEPIAIAYGAAKAREVLGCLPERMLVEASGNIIKNVKSVVVPNTGGLKGIAAAAAAGAVAGDPGKILEVISSVTQEQKAEIKDYLESREIQVRPAPGEVVFDVILTLWAGGDSVRLRIADYHTNIVLIEKNGEPLLKCGAVTPAGESASGLTDRSCLSVDAIVDFADTVELEDVAAPVERQLEYNCAIAREGMARDWGANIGKVLREYYGEDVKVRARWMVSRSLRTTARRSFSWLTPSSWAYTATGTEAVIPWLPLPETMMTGISHPLIRASLPAAAQALASVLMSAG